MITVIYIIHESFSFPFSFSFSRMSVMKLNEIIDQNHCSKHKDEKRREI